MASHLHIGWAAARLGYAAYITNRRRTNALLASLKGVPLHTARRIHYYTIQSAVTNLWFSTLRGQAPSSAEHQMGLWIGAITPLIDDAMDEQGYASGHLLERLQYGSDPAFAQASALYQRILQEGSTVLVDMAMKTLAAQDAGSSQQQLKPLTSQQLQKITSGKGGFATLLYRHILHHPVPPEEANAIHVLGYLLQMTNDAFDVYKDYHAGLQTMFTHAGDIAPLKTHYLEQIALMKQAFYATPYPRANVRAMLHQVMLVVTRGLVAIDQLLERQQQHGRFQVSDFERKALICDMEKVGNIWKTWQMSRRMV